MKIVKSNTPRDVILHQDEYPANLEPTDVVEIFETNPNTLVFNNQPNSTNPGNLEVR